MKNKSDALIVALEQLYSQLSLPYGVVFSENGYISLTTNSLVFATQREGHLVVKLGGGSVAESSLVALDVPRGERAIVADRFSTRVHQFLFTHFAVAHPNSPSWVTYRGDPNATAV